MKTPRFSRVELKIQGVAGRQANSQLLRVPWRRFRSAYEQYPRWQALALWGEAVVETAEGHIPPVLSATLKKHCPGFIEGGEPSQPEPLALHLLEWVHARRFGYVKREGWLGALTFYGVRHLQSECAWAYWERCENEWHRQRLIQFPSFEKWFQAALQLKLCGEITHLEVAKAVEEYLDWEALGCWLRPLFASHAKLPRHVISELGHVCPGILGRQNSGTHQGSEEGSAIGRRLNEWGKNHCLSEAREAGWLDFLLKKARSHPRHLRIVAYGTRWAKEWSRDHSWPYPSFGEWQQAADRYIAARPK